MQNHWHSYLNRQIIVCAQIFLALALLSQHRLNLFCFCLVGSKDISIIYWMNLVFICCFVPIQSKSCLKLEVQMSNLIKLYMQCKQLHFTFHYEVKISSKSCASIICSQIITKYVGTRVKFSRVIIQWTVLYVSLPVCIPYHLPLYSVTQSDYRKLQSIFICTTSTWIIDDVYFRYLKT